MYSNQTICNILIYIDNNLNKKITINELEKQFFYNKYYLMKLFKKEIKVSILEYINILRIKNSINEIKSTNNSLTTIFINNGFYSLEYFSETFKKITGVNPTTFKKFLLYNKEIKDEDINKIRNSLIFLKEIEIQKDKYLKNQKPTTTYVKKLSIFNK